MDAQCSRYGIKDTKGWKRNCYARHHELCKNKDGKCKCPCHMDGNVTATLVTDEVKSNE